MNEQHTKSFRAAYDYWFENKPLNEALSSLRTEEIKKEEPKQEVIAESKKEEKIVKEGFDTHVLCNHCGSGDLQLSKQKTKIRCKECGNVGLTESIAGLNNEMARTKEQYQKGKEKASKESVARKQNLTEK